MKKPQQVGQIEPKAAVQATGIQPSVDKCVMPLDHHETVAFQTVHEARPPTKGSARINGAGS
jgi:hypothetical protein